MLTKRVIPCLDIKDGRVVKGVNFVGIKDVADPIETALEYEKQGADEIVLLDITATNEGRATIIDVVRDVAKKISIPITIGGGIGSCEDIEKLLTAGAKRISINSAAVKNPELISDGAKKFGSECIVVAIDGKMVAPNKYTVVINGGNVDANLDVVEWAKECEKLGAGEILLTSMDADGCKNGFDINMTKAVTDAVNIPVVASGGCGKLEHFSEVFEETGADGALAASLFHFKELTVKEVKDHLTSKNIPVRR